MSIGETTTEIMSERGESTDITPKLSVDIKRIDPGTYAHLLTDPKEVGFEGEKAQFLEKIGARIYKKTLPSEIVVIPETNDVLASINPKGKPETLRSRAEAIRSYITDGLTIHDRFPDHFARRHFETEIEDKYDAETKERKILNEFHSERNQFSANRIGDTILKIQGLAVTLSQMGNEEKANNIKIAAINIQKFMWWNYGELYIALNNDEKLAVVSAVEKLGIDALSSIFGGREHVQTEQVQTYDVPPYEFPKQDSQ